MQSGTDGTDPQGSGPPAPVSSQNPQRPTRIRSRIGAACIRCQRRKIRGFKCDTRLPACGACQKVGAQCVGGGTAREIPRSYVNELEARIEWLESIIRENLPGIDLSAGPDSRSNTSRDKDPLQEDASLRKITDQIGLVSIAAGADLRYLGPSSGLFFTKFVLTGLGRRIQIERPSTLDLTADESLSIPPDLLLVQPRELPPDEKHARWLSQAYFDSVHLQFPFLHERIHLQTIQTMYDGINVGPVLEFQVFMVLAIGATIQSRKAKVMLSAEGYYASAMDRLDSTVQATSLGGLQGILLLQMYTLNNPSSGLSLWPLHYHGLALTIELGLQREVPDDKFTPFEKQMRTRTFWSIYTIDRLLSTLMGRPIGVMDEQCELRLPLDVNDSDLHLQPHQQVGTLTNMTTAIHLFKLTRLISETKCVLYCVDRQYPPYTQPAVTDVESWKAEMLDRLGKWKTDIPRHPEGSPQYHMNLLCEIKYHEHVMLILRPSPLFQHPGKASVRECFASALECSKLYHRLYTAKALHFGWSSTHSLFVCVMVMFYCVWTPQGIADEADFDCLMRSLKASSDVLSAMGEYWPEAARSRGVLDRISMATLRRFTDKINATRSNNTLVGSQADVDILSGLIQGQPADWMNLGTAPNLFPSTQFGNGSTRDDFASTGYYGTQDDSFTSADVLSYFLGPGEDAEMDGSGLNGGYQPDADDVIRSLLNSDV